MRLGVALLLEGAAAAEIDGLRRALGDRALDRIAPHITLVPPVNVGGSRIGEGLARLREAAADCAGPFPLTLGPPASFLPANPVLLLGVAGDISALRRLREAVFVPPLERTLSWPWVPHVTLADDADPDHIAAAVEILAGYKITVEAKRITLLSEVKTHHGPRWAPLADADLGPAPLVGRGGLELTLTRSSMLDPEAVALADSVVAIGASEVHADLPWARPRLPMVIVAGRRAGSLVGVGVAWLDDAGGHVTVIVDPGVRDQGIGSHVLAHVEAAVIDVGWSCPVLAALGPPGFYRSRSAWSVPT